TTSTGVFSKNDVDFGSRLLIETIKKPDIEAPILDLGCGYGPIGLSLAKKHPDTLVKMIDITSVLLKCQNSMQLKTKLLMLILNKVMGLKKWLRMINIR